MRLMKIMKYLITGMGLWGLAFCAGALAGAADEELEALVAEALAQNPQVALAKYQVDGALARRDELRGFFDPQLALSLEQTDSVLGYNQS